MGNRGGSTGGGGGGVGPAGKKRDGTYGTKKMQKKVSNRNETRKAVKEFVEGGGVTGAIVKGISNQIKKSKEKRVERKVNDTLIGTPDYQGDVAKKPKKVTTPIGGNDRNDNPPPKVETPKVETKKSVEQPKVKSQMDNTEVKSKNITADKTAPTETEMPTEELTEDEKLLRRKRGRKTRTVLTSVTGDNTKATLSRRTLLGV